MAGLQLAALSLQGHADPAGFVQTFTGSHRDILDYLTEEVPARQPEELVRFLLETSVLERLSGPLCDAVCGFLPGSHLGVTPQPARSPSVGPGHNGRWCARVLRVEVSTTVEAPRETVLGVYADYAGWPRLFPTIGGVQLLGRQGPKLVLQVDHAEGKVLNELVVRPPDRLDLWEEKRRYDAWFRNRFDSVPGGTRFTARGEFHLKGWARLLRPFLGGFARRQMRRLQLEPVKAEAEARARAGRSGGPARTGGELA